MEIFQWVRTILLGTVVVIAVRLVTVGLGWEQVAFLAGALGVLLVFGGAALAIIGVIHDRASRQTSDTHDSRP